MDETLLFGNWSLKTLLKSESDTLNKARMRIIMTILVFTLVKMLIVVTVAFLNDQNLQFVRISIMIILNIGLMKLQLSGKQFTVMTAHILVIVGLIFIWSNMAFVIRGVNIVSLQFMFMVILISFYLHDRKFGISYAILSTLPVLFYLLQADDMRLIGNVENELASPGYEIIIVLNFCTLIISHYIYHKAFSTNVMEKENLNKQLMLAVKDANHAAQSKSDFLSTMSHELRTPLNSVIGMAELLQNNTYNPEQADNIQILNFSAQNLRSLINDILDYNKLGSEKLNLESIDLDLHELLSDVCSGLRYLAEQKGLQLLLEIDPGIKGQRVVTDPTRLIQIINNLAGNAIKFTTEGIVFVQVQLLGKSEGKIDTRFSIIDTGIGIDEDTQAVIFEPFTQASSSTTRQYGGTGLGLAIVKRLLHLFDSNIYLESSHGAGSKFYFDLSFLTTESQQDQDVSGPDSNNDLRGLRVLVAEDNPMNRMLLQKIFSQWGCESVFAENGQLALDILLESQFDLVLMDIHMPIMDGYETSRQIRQLANRQLSKIPIIALTASVSNDLDKKITEVGMNDFIHKPFHSRDLYLKLQEILREVRSGENSLVHN